MFSKLKAILCSFLISLLESMGKIKESATTRRNWGLEASFHFFLPLLYILAFLTWSYPWSCFTTVTCIPFPASSSKLKIMKTDRRTDNVITIVSNRFHWACGQKWFCFIIHLYFVLHGSDLLFSDMTKHDVSIAVTRCSRKSER